MSEYVPTTDEVLGMLGSYLYEYGAGCDMNLPGNSPDEIVDRWLAAHDAEVAAKALEDAAGWMQDGIGEPYNPRETNYAQQSREAKARRAWLRARAAEYRKAVRDDR